MTVATETRSMTAADLLALGDAAGRCELVRGELVTLAPAGAEHGELAATVVAALVEWNRRHRAGRVTGAETGILLARDPDTVRAPDAAYISRERLGGPLPKGYLEVPPDLVVEVVSPSDRQAEVLAKVGQWLDFGVPMVWLVWPEPRRVWVWRSGHEIETLAEGDTIDGGAVLPGFSLAVSEVFPTEE